MCSGWTTGKSAGATWMCSDKPVCCATNRYGRKGSSELLGSSEPTTTEKLGYRIRLFIEAPLPD
jgi:hypothetical protein